MHNTSDDAPSMARSTAANSTDDDRNRLLHHQHHHVVYCGDTGGGGGGGGRRSSHVPPAQRKSAKKQRCTTAGGGKKKSTAATPRRRRLTHVLAGVALGLLIGYAFNGSYDRLRSYADCTGRWPSATPSSELRPWPAAAAHGGSGGGGDDKPSSADNGTAAESLLFVGVMTADRYLATRAAAVHRTWARRVPGRVMFYSAETSARPPGMADLPLVRLATVDDAYPPQKKSFLMLQHMWDHYGGTYEWFMRADDDVYVRPDRLAALLRSVDSRKPLFIGQAGRGKQEEFGLLSLEYDENFCMGGPGVIMSRETLSRVVPHIKHCLRNLFTTHEDVELGRCVQKYAGVSCTWSYEVNKYFSSRLCTTNPTPHSAKRQRFALRSHNIITTLFHATSRDWIGS